MTRQFAIDVSPVPNKLDGAAPSKNGYKSARAEKLTLMSHSHCAQVCHKTINLFLNFSLMCLRHESHDVAWFGGHT